MLSGVLPTPGASVLVRRYGFDMAAVVSASHNPYPDNGIKFFGPEGMKIGDDQEAEIEQRLEEPSALIGRLRELHGAGGDYLRELQLRFSSLDLSGLRVLLDCANGATHRVAPEIFRRMGAEVDAIAVEPDGRNINQEVGSTHIDALSQHMDNHDVAFALRATATVCVGPPGTVARRRADCAGSASPLGSGGSRVTRGRDRMTNSFHPRWPTPDEVAHRLGRRTCCRAGAPRLGARGEHPATSSTRPSSPP